MIVLKKRPYLYNWSGNSIYYELYNSDAVDDVTVLFEVQVMFRLVSEADFREICIVPFTPIEGTVRFNLQDVLHVHLKWQVPDLHPGLTIVQCDQQVGQFYINFRSTSPLDSNPGWDDTQSENVCLIVKGGIHLFSFKGNNYWLNYFPTKKPFFTWQQSGRKASRTERMYLSWLNLFISDATSLQVKALVTFTDTTTGTVIIPVLGHQLNRIYFIPAGAKELGLQALQPLKTIWYWEITVMNITPAIPVAVSETFLYNADNRNDYNGTTLMYRNSLGGMDTVRVRGVIDPSTEYTFIESTNVVKSDYFVSDLLPSVEAVQDAMEIQIFKGDIGHLGRSDQDRLRDAFLQRQVLQEIRSKWQPMKLLTKSVKLGSKKDKRFTIPIEWQLADGGSYFYTPAGIDLGEGSNISNVTDAIITDLKSTVTLNGDNTVATASHTFNITSESGEVITEVRYRVGQIGLWIPLVFPSGLPLLTTHNPNEIISIFFKAVNNGIVGQYTIGEFVTFIFATSGSSRISNTSNMDQTASITVNGLEVAHNVSMAAGGSYDFSVADVSSSNVVVNFDTYEPSAGYLYSGGVLTKGAILVFKYIVWNPVDLVTPFTIIFL